MGGVFKFQIICFHDHYTMQSGHAESFGKVRHLERTDIALGHQ